MYSMQEDRYMTQVARTKTDLKQRRTKLTRKNFSTTKKMMRRPPIPSMEKLTANPSKRVMLEFTVLDSETFF